MTFEEILRSDEYHNRFRQPSPFYLENGTAYYRPVNLCGKISDYQKRLLKTKLSKDVWFYANSIAIMKLQLKQAEWIEQGYGSQVFGLK